MKYVRIVLLSMVLMGITHHNQAQGINFYHKLDEALQVAKRENKMVFVDFYTSWCGPCKMMAADIFPQKEVGDFYNTNFVSVKIQCDDKGEGVEIGKKYKVAAYPTLAYLDKNGEMVHAIAGGLDARGFIALAKTALDPNKNQLTLVKEWDVGNRKQEFMVNYFQTLISSYRREKAHYDYENYFQTLSKVQKASKNNYELMRILNVGPFSGSFEYLENNKKDYYKTIGKAKIDSMIATAYLWYFKGLQASGDSNKDLSEFNAKMLKFKAKKYPFYDEYAQFYEVLDAKDAAGKYDTELYQKLGTAFLAKYGLKNDAYTTSLSHTLGNLTGKADQGAAAIQWMEALLKRNRSVGNLNTYFYVLWRNFRLDQAAVVIDELRQIAIKENRSTEQIDKQIQMIKDLKVKYK